MDNYITIGDLDLIETLEDHYKLLIDDSTNGDTKAAFVSILKSYLVEEITPRINKEKGVWYVGNENTGVKVSDGIDIWTNGMNYKLNKFVENNNIIYKCIVSPQEDDSVFNESEWLAMSSKIDFLSNQEILEMIGEIWGGDLNE